MAETQEPYRFSTLWRAMVSSAGRRVAVTRAGQNEADNQLAVLCTGVTGVRNIYLGGEVKRVSAAPGEGEDAAVTREGHARLDEGGGGEAQGGGGRGRLSMMTVSWGWPVELAAGEGGGGQHHPWGEVGELPHPGLAVFFKA